jgi:hypothetical protein
MSRSSWNSETAILCVSHLRLVKRRPPARRSAIAVRRVVMGIAAALGSDIAFDRESELGEVRVADDAPELGLGFEHAALGRALERVGSRVARLAA